MSIALAHAGTPLPLEITVLPGLACPLMIRMAGTIAAPSIAARLLKVLCMGSFSPFRDGQRHGAQAKTPHVTERCRRKIYIMSHAEQEETLR
jgi:hypothetical protein